MTTKITTKITVPIPSPCIWDIDDSHATVELGHVVMKIKLSMCRQFVRYTPNRVRVGIIGVRDVAVARIPIGTMRTYSPAVLGHLGVFEPIDDRPEYRVDVSYSNKTINTRLNIDTWRTLVSQINDYRMTKL